MKIVKIIIVMIIIFFILVGVNLILAPTEKGNIVLTVFENIFCRKFVDIPKNPDKIKLTYQNDILSSTLEITDPNEINDILKYFKNKTYVHHIIGANIAPIQNQIDFGNGTKFYFSGTTRRNEYAYCYRNYDDNRERNPYFKTTIPVEAKELIYKKLEEAKLTTSNAYIFNTSKITITDNDNTEIIIENKSDLDLFLNKCSGISKDENITSVNTDLTLDFNNGVILEFNKTNQNGLTYDGILHYNNENIYVSVSSRLLHHIENLITNYKNGL